MKDQCLRRKFYHLIDNFFVNYVFLVWGKIPQHVMGHRCLEFQIVTFSDIQYIIWKTADSMPIDRFMLFIWTTKTYITDGRFRLLVAKPALIGLKNIQKNGFIEKKILLIIGMKWRMSSTHCESSYPV